MPRIDVLPFFEGGPGEHRRYEFDRNRCNDTYYSRDYYDSSSEDCKDLFRQIGTQFGDGAIRKYQWLPIIDIWIYTYVYKLTDSEVIMT